MELVSEEQYQETMDNQVVPALRHIGKYGYFERIEGQKIYYEHFKAANEKAVLVLVHGYTEGVSKFYETALYFLKEGISVWLIQQREHGKSYRSTDNPYLVNIEDYHDLILDLRYFVRHRVKRSNTEGKPMYLYGHSMGGGVAACYLEAYPDDFEKAVLSSPMLELNAGGTPVWLMTLYAKFMIRIGKGEKYMPGAGPFTGKYDFEGSNTNSRARYEYTWQEVSKHPELQMCAPSLNTGLQLLEITKYAGLREHIKKIRANVLLIQAGKDGTVLPKGQNRFIERLGSRGTFLRIEDAKHEIYRCSNKELTEYWPAILDFLEG